ncbi:MAG: hypothetical protein ABI616_13415 [Pseudomonadota bacterium]
MKIHKSACAVLVLISACGAGVAAAADTSAAAPTPRAADGHPDFNGVWDNGGGIDFLSPQKLADGSVCVTGCAPPAANAAAGPPSPRPPPDRPRYKPEFAAKVSDLEAKQVKFDPVLRCQPPGVPRIGPPDKIVQTAREMVFLYEDVSGPFFRIVPLVTGAVRQDDSPSYLGDASGHWDGDTLVVETANFNDLTWLADNGAFHTEALRVTERLTRRGNEMEYRAVVQDPGVLAEPWQMRPRRMTLMDKEMAEPAPCVDQDLHLMLDDSHHTNPR